MIISRCPICRSFKKRGQIVCDLCNEKLRQDKFDSYLTRCKHCGYPKLNELYKCVFCSDTGEYKIYPVFDYLANFSKNILYSYKFSGRKDLKLIFSSIFDNSFKNNPFVENNFVIVPVPCSNESFKRRGWDQMIEICKVLRRKYKYRYMKLIENSSVKEEQKKLDRQERIESSQTKYSINNNIKISKDTQIIVIDDVVTTGSTMKACINLLRSNGYKNVIGISLFAQLRYNY